MFIVYLGVVAAITIVPTHLTGFRNPHSFHINFIPLDYSFSCFMQDWGRDKSPTAFCLRNTIGNFALFVPLGMLLPLVSKRFPRLKRVLVFALCLSVSIESIQFVLRFFGNPRAVDIDDVILNTLGACFGYALYRISNPRTSGKARDDEDRSGGRDASADSIDRANS